MKDQFDTLRTLIKNVAGADLKKPGEREVVTSAAIAALDILEQVVGDLHTIAHHVGRI